MFRRWGLYIALLLTVGLQAAVYTPSSVPNPKDYGQAYYVANPDALLADSDVIWLNQCAASLESATRVELCVVALESIGEADAFDFSYELFQRWGLGKKGQNTGVLILFAEQSHDIRIMTGVGIEGVLTDAQCSQIIRDQMTPAFRKGDYGGGLCLGALRIYEICTDGEAPEELRNARSVTNRGQYGDEDEAFPWLGFIFLMVFLIVIIYVIWWASDKNKGGGSSWGSGGSGGYYGGGYHGGGFSGGFGGGGSWGGGSTFGGGAGGKW